MDKEKIINKIGLSILYMLGWITVYNLPRKFFHVGGNNGIEAWFLVFMMFLFLPFLLFQILKRNKLSKEASKGFAYGSVFLAIPFALFIQRESDIELEKFKQETVGIVNKAWMLKGRTRTPIWNVQAKYQVNGKTHQTSSKDDKDKILSFGDTITIIYSSKTPEMSEIKELIEYYEK